MATDNFISSGTSIKAKHLKFGEPDLIFKAPHKGLRVRANKDGTKSFYWRYSKSGLTKKVTLGVLSDEYTVTAAMFDFEKLKGKLKNEDLFDPQSYLHAIRKDELAEYQKQNSPVEPDNFTVKRLLDFYIVNHCEEKLSYKRAKELKRLSDNDIIPLIGDVEAKNITAQNIETILDPPYKRSAYSVVANVFDLLKQSYIFANERSSLELNTPFPLEKIPSFYRATDEMKDIKSKAKSPVSIKELALLFKAEDIKQSKAIDAFILMCVTGCRPKEVLALEWAEIDEDVMCLPKQRTKTKVARDIRLSPYALKLIRKYASDDDIYTFKGRHNKTAYSTKAVNTQIQRTLPEASCYSGRKTCKTLMMATGCPYIVSEMALGHAKGELDKAYDHHDYEHEVYDQRLKLSTIIEQLRTNEVFREFFLSIGNAETKRIILKFTSTSRVLAFVKSLSDENIVTLNEVQHG